VERVIGTLKGYLVKYISMYGIANRDPVDNLQVILDSITDAYNYSRHSTIGARPVEMWLGIDWNHQKIKTKEYPKYLLGTYVLKRPDVGTNVVTKRMLNYDPEIYQIVRADGQGYTIKSLFGNERIKNLRYWMIHPITEKEGAKILNNPVNVSYIIRKLMNKYRITRQEALDRIGGAKENLQELIALSPD
jgi:hypothetical protein